MSFIQGPKSDPMVSAYSKSRLTHSAGTRVPLADWNRAIEFPGCEVKPLYIDAKTGQATLLIRTAPAGMLPDDEHALLEQTCRKGGWSTTNEGPDEGLSLAGEFVWRERVPPPREFRCPTGPTTLKSQQFQTGGDAVDDHAHVEYATATGNDYVAHEQMYRKFVTLARNGVLLIAGIVVLMAIFLV